MNKPDNKARERGRKPVTIAELQTRSVCKKRYGRASLTIRRWGGLGEFIDDTALSKKLAAFSTGEATAEEVAWAFVRARVEKHSPTFSWKAADLVWLIEIVTECSESPQIEARTPEELARALVKAQDAEREQLRKLSQQLARSFTGVAGLSPFTAMPALTQWAEQQRRTMDAVSRSFVTPPFSERLSAIMVTPRLTEQLDALGLGAHTRRWMFPVLEPTLVQRVKVPNYGDLFAQKVRLPDASFRMFSESMQRSLGLYRTYSLAPALQTLAQSQTFTIQQVVEAAVEATELAEWQGDHEQAVEIEALTAEIVEVVHTPSVAKLEQMVADLSDRLEEHSEVVETRLDEAEEREERDSEKRDRQRQDDLVLNFYLWFLAVYLAYFLWILDHLPNPP